MGLLLKRQKFNTIIFTNLILQKPRNSDRVYVLLGQTSSWNVYYIGYFYSPMGMLSFQGSFLIALALF